MWRSNRRNILIAVGGLAILAAIIGASRSFGRGTAADVPTTVVTKGEFIDYLQVRGEVKAVRSVPLTVPTTGGGDLQILELAKNGMNVKKGDIVGPVRSDECAANALRSPLRVQAGRGGNRQDEGAVPHPGAADADRRDRRRATTSSEPSSIRCRTSFFRAWNANRRC
jgi:hypothetical protein